MRLLSLLAASASLIGLAAAIPEGYPGAVPDAYLDPYPNAEELENVGQIGKRSLINNLEPRELCNGSIVLDTSTQPYTIVSGDTLTKIAEKFKRGICDIASYNNITNPDFILSGATITIPPQKCIPDSTSCISNAKPTATCVNGGPGFYIVQKGDTLGQIATAFNITLDAVEGANKANIPNPDVIEPGQIVNIPICADSTCTVSAYTIKKGDTFYLLGRRYKSSQGQNQAVNPGVNANSLQIGQVVTLISFCHKFPGTEPADEL